MDRSCSCRARMCIPDLFPAVYGHEIHYQTGRSHPYSIVSADALLHQLNVKNGVDIPSFEALLRVKVANDIPLETQLITLRKTNP
jgi:hypothetical protein